MPASAFSPNFPAMKKLTVYLILAFAPILTFAQQKLTKEEQKLIEQIDKNYQETLALLEEVININSGSLNKEGVREVGRVFEREFQKKSDSKPNG